MKHEIKHTLMISCLIVLCGMSGAKTLAKGFWSNRPAQSWEEYLVAGNGTYGLMVAGNPNNEVMVFNHTNLFLPVHAPLVPPSQGNRLGEIRQLMLDGKYDEASKLMVEISHNDGFGKKRQSDLFVPAFQLCIGRDSLPASDYRRSVDFDRGEIQVQWKDRKGEYLRRAFVSRPDSVIVSEISAQKGLLNLQLDLEMVTRFDAKRQAKFCLDERLGRQSVEIKNTATGGEARMLVKVHYATPWKNGYVGYVGEVLLRNEGGKMTVSDNRIIVQKAKRLKLVARLEPVKDTLTEPSLFEAGLQPLLAQPYDELLTKNETQQRDLMERVSLDLGADSTTLQLPAEELLKLGGQHPALIQHLFDAARYNIISATGTNPPNLQGIWGATMTPPWAGDYTTNGNLPTATAHYLAASTPELMLPLFRKLESQMDEYRTNARVLFGCRGIHVPSHIQLHGYDNQFDATWPMTFWTAGAAWYAMLYYDYYLYTRDEDFLRNHALPFMLESVAFYEDFLTYGTDGKLMFCPSYSPENHPANSKPQACINATMDIAVCKALLRDLLATGYGTDAQKNRWQKMLQDLPAYAVNGRGELREWTWQDLQDNHEHRHASHLIGLFYRHDPEIMHNDTLREGALRAIRQRLDYRKSQSGVMAFGLSQLAFPACALGQGEMAYDMLQMAGETYFNNNLMTTHDPHKIFNTDMSGAYPAIVMDMLVYSDAGVLDLLPACPKAWAQGSIDGMSARGGIRIDHLSWTNNSVHAVLTSKVDQTLQITARGGAAQSISLHAGVPSVIELSTNN